MKYEVQTSDPIVIKNIKELDMRSVVGVSKYNTTLQQNMTDNFLQHLLEEQLDAANYIQKLMSLEKYRPDNYKSYHAYRIKELFFGGKSDSEKLDDIANYFNIER